MHDVLVEPGTRRFIDRHSAEAIDDILNKPIDSVGRRKVICNM